MNPNIDKLEEKKKEEKDNSVGRFIVSQGQTHSLMVYYEVDLPDGEYKLYASPVSKLP
jgi:hypothetical protein